MLPKLILDEAELVAFTGYRQPSHQLAELHRRGFWRAQRSPTTGAVILTRAHFEAVEAGQQAQQPPKVRPPKLRVA